MALNYLLDQAAADVTAADVQQLGARASTYRADVSCEGELITMFERATTDLGPLTGVVVNAGIVAPSLPLVEMTAERIRGMFEVNAVGSYLTAREAARWMSHSTGGQGGAIVLVSSAAARLGSAFEYVDYAGSKASLDTLAIGLSKELAREGVRVNSVRPGLIETEIHASGGRPDRAQVVGAQAPLGRPGSAEEVAEAIFWLLSDAASYVTGSILDVAGGR